MSSFTKKLVLNCTGVIFISFLIVYFLFNAMVSSYIRGEAERELTGGITDAAGLAEAIHISFMPYDMFATSDVTISMTAPEGLSRFISAIPSPHPSARIRMGEFREFGITQRIAVEETQFDLIFETPIFPPTYYLAVDGATLVMDMNAVEFVPPLGVVSTYRAIRPVQQRPSIINTDMIMIDNNENILTPAVEYLRPAERAQVEFLSAYFLANIEHFKDNQMRRVSGTSGTFYVTADIRRFLDGSLTTLMYTDISSAMEFTNSMNRILGALLVISGLLSLIISIVMSTRFKRAIARLCNHAETIGRGNFNAQAGKFKDAEFAQLSTSMHNMANMLQAYENSQKQFFQNASHELRTPLMSIQGYAVGIMREVFTKEEAADIILSESEKMAALVDELLYISRMDSTKEIKTESLNINNLLQECCERIKPIAPQKQITLTTPPQEISIKANEEKLERAIINILSNAARHAETTITVTLTAEAETITIQIQDDGEGISPEAIPHLFERFYKGENGNHGLGLAISKDIIKSLGGKITANNAPDKGALFTITTNIR